MVETVFHAPLTWPAHYPENTSKTRITNSTFSTDLTISESLRLLQDEINDLRCERVVINTDIEQISVERLRRKLGNHPGAFLELKIAGKLYLFACDRWNSLEHNLYALHLMLRSFRLMEKWAVADLSRLMQGFLSDRHSTTAAELGVVNEEWMQQLGLGPTATLDDAHATYRRRAKLVANDEQALMHLNNAMDHARKKLVP